jgi:hypothetical protein
MYPHLRFDEGSIMALDLPERSLGGIVAWHSIIHTPPERLPLAFAEFSRVLSPGGHLLLAFQVGSNQRVRLEQAYGHQVSYDAFRLCPDHVTDLLGQAQRGVAGIRRPAGASRTSTRSTASASATGDRGGLGLEDNATRLRQLALG